MYTISPSYSQPQLKSCQVTRSTFKTQGSINTPTITLPKLKNALNQALTPFIPQFPKAGEFKSLKENLVSNVNDKTMVKSTNSSQSHLETKRQTTTCCKQMPAAVKAKKSCEASLLVKLQKIAPASLKIKKTRE